MLTYTAITFMCVIYCANPEVLPDSRNAVKTDCPQNENAQIGQVLGVIKPPQMPKQNCVHFYNDGRIVSHSYLCDDCSRHTNSRKKKEKLLVCANTTAMKEAQASCDTINQRIFLSREAALASACTADLRTTTFGAAIIYTEAHPRFWHNPGHPLAENGYVWTSPRCTKSVIEEASSQEAVSAIQESFAYTKIVPVPACWHFYDAEKDVRSVPACR